MKNVSYENKVVLSFIDFVLFILKWLSLCACVIYTALTIGFAIMNLIEHTNEISNFFVSMVSAVTGYSFSEASVLISRIGKTNALIGTLFLGTAVSLNNLFIYMISTRLKALFNSFMAGNLYTKENLKLMDQVIPLSLLLAIILPIVKFFVVISVGMLDFTNISLFGFIFLFVSMVLKMLIESGYDLSVQLEKKSLELSNLKADDIDKRIETLKEQIKTEKVKKKTTEVKEEKEDKPKKRRYYNKNKKTATKTK